MVLPRSSKLSVESTVSLLDAFLDRSKTLAFSFVLRTQSLYSKTAFHFLIGIWDIMSPHLHRCRNFCFVDQSGDSKVLDLFFPLSKHGSFARLESLSVTIHGDPEGPLSLLLSKPLFGGLEVASNLVNLTVQNVRLVERLPNSITQLRLIYRQLRNDQIDGPYVCSVLAQCAHTLERLDLYFPLGQLEPPSTPIFLPHLRLIDVGDCRFDRYVTTNENLEQVTCRDFAGNLNSIRLASSVKRLTLHHPMPLAFDHWSLVASDEWGEGIEILEVNGCFGADCILNMLLPISEEEKGEEKQNGMGGTSHCVTSGKVLTSLRTLRLKSYRGGDNSPAATWRHVLKLLDSRPGLRVECGWSFFEFKRWVGARIQDYEKNKAEQDDIFRNWTKDSDDRIKYGSRLHITVY